jgi:MFS transporter, AAHS family, 4-hydroxybenzoate transporter
MRTLERATVSEFIDASSLSRTQVFLIALCAAVVFFDGFDLLVIGFVMPAIGEALHIPLASFGPIFSAGLLGTMIGGLVFGPVADRYGRKWTIVSCVGLFGIFSLLTTIATSTAQLAGMRFFTGLGLGGAAPVAVALVSEYTPQRVRSRVVSVIWTAFPVGGLLAAFLSAALISKLGWQSIFVIGAVLPLAVAALLALFLHESLYSLLRQGQVLKAKAIMQRINPELAVQDVVVGAENSTASPKLMAAVGQLLEPGRIAPTLLLWVIFFCTFAVINFFAAWSPSLLHNTGIDLKTATIVGAMGGIGALIGTATVGTLIDRFGSRLVMGLGYLLALVFTAPIGLLTSSIPLLTACLILSNVCYGAGSAGAITLAGNLYAPALRSTGIGWAMSMARLAQVLMPLAVSALVALGVDTKAIFFLALLPGVIALVAFMSLRFVALPAQMPLRAATS